MFQDGVVDRCKFAMASIDGQVNGFAYRILVIRKLICVTTHKHCKKLHLICNIVQYNELPCVLNYMK